jgi:hypothetical protein
MYYGGIMFVQNVMKICKVVKKLQAESKDS